MKKTDIAAELKALVKKNNQNYDGPAPARYIPATDLMKLAKELQAEVEAGFWYRLTHSWQSFAATVASPFVKAYHYFYPLPLEKVQRPPVGFTTWADVPKHLRFANPAQGNANPIKLEEGESASAKYGSNVLVSLTGDKRVAFLGDESAIPMVSPEDFGLTPRQAKLVRDGKGYDVGNSPAKVSNTERVQMNLILKAIQEHPPKTQEEAKGILKIVETALGKKAQVWLAERAAAEAAAAEARSDGANAAVGDALEIAGAHDGDVLEAMRLALDALESIENPRVSPMENL